MGVVGCYGRMCGNGNYLLSGDSAGHCNYACGIVGRRIPDDKEDGYASNGTAKRRG